MTMISFQLPADMARRLEVRAKARRMSRSALIRGFIEQGMAPASESGEELRMILRELREIRRIVDPESKES